MSLLSPKQAAIDNQVDCPKKPEVLLQTDGEVSIYWDFFTSQESEILFFDLKSNAAWRQDVIKVYGKTILLPRLTAWYGDQGKAYTYSGITMQPQPWSSSLLKIKSKVEQAAGVQFNSVLLNQYRDGSDSVSWHSDDEPELGKSPIIGSVSFGASRSFVFKHKTCKDLDNVKVDLTDGSFLLMRGETQQHWLHQVPKTKKRVDCRVNLTFRLIY